MQDRLLFLISSPRSGSTLLQRMLASHEHIFSRSECHLLTPLAHQGYFYSVEAAKYHVGNTERAMHDLVHHLPEGEVDYLAACRAYTDAIYQKLLDSSGRRLFLDKTPAYALVGDFVRRLYPKARYIILTRHPLAVLHSFATTFTDGDYERAYDHQPLLDRYVPAVAELLRADINRIHLRYEDLVANPGSELKRIFEFLELEHDPAVIYYGQHNGAEVHALGDPKIYDRARPSTDSVLKWAGAMKSSPRKAMFARDIVAGLDPLDLQQWGYPAEMLFDPCESATAVAQKPGSIRPYRIKRRFLGGLRRLLRDRPALQQVVRRVRDGCQLLLRS